MSQFLHSFSPLAETSCMMFALPQAFWNITFPLTSYCSSFISNNLVIHVNSIDFWLWQHEFPCYMRYNFQTDYNNPKLYIPLSGQISHFHFHDVNTRCYGSLFVFIQVFELSLFTLFRCLFRKTSGSLNVWVVECFTFTNPTIFTSFVFLTFCIRCNRLLHCCCDFNVLVFK